MARVEVHAGLAAIEYPNSLVDVHAATDAWSRVCWPLGMTTILPVTRVTGRASSRPAIVRSRSGLRERRGELRGRPRGDEEHFKRGGLRAAGCPKEERLLCLCETGLPKGGEEGLLLECGVLGSARMRGQRFLRF